MKPIANPTDIDTYLNQLVDDYTDLIIEQTKNLIIFETKEKYEDCADIQTFMNNIGEVLAQTIEDVSNVPKEMTLTRLADSRQTIYQKLKETFEI